MEDEVSWNIAAELSKRGTFGGFSEEIMLMLLEGIWNNVEYDLKVNYKSVLIQKY